MSVLIGSRAVRQWFPDFPREPKDYDYAIDYGDPKKAIVRKEGDAWEEYHTIKPITDRHDISFGDHAVATPAELLTLKISHIFWDIKWDKTMWDIHWLREKGVDPDWELFLDLFAHWTVVHGLPERANLAMNADRFFDNAIKDGHNHDTLHTYVKEVPTYTKILKEGAEVEIDQDKFFALPISEALDVIREECYVMAYERMGNRDYRDAYKEQLKQWILHHAPSVEMAMTAVRNYKELVKPLINYKEVIDYGRRPNV